MARKSGENEKIKRFCQSECYHQWIACNLKYSSTVSEKLVQIVFACFLVIISSQSPGESCEVGKFFKVIIIWGWPGDAGGSETLLRLISCVDDECSRRSTAWSLHQNISNSLIWTRFAFRYKSRSQTISKLRWKAISQLELIDLILEEDENCCFIKITSFHFRPEKCQFASSVLEMCSSKIHETCLENLVSYLLLVSYLSHITPRQDWIFSWIKIKFREGFKKSK